jgi:hypothetical protein
MASSDDFDDSMKRICCACVNDAYLSAEIKQNGSIAQCSYCGEDAEAWDIEDLADRIEVAFDEHFYRTSDQPNSWQERLLADREPSAAQIFILGHLPPTMLLRAE